MVCEVTDDKTKSMEERKELQITHAPTLSLGAKLIKLADKISNLNSLASSPPVDWTPQRRQDYVEWCQKVVERLRGANTMLESCSARPQRPPEGPTSTPRDGEEKVCK